MVLDDFARIMENLPQVLVVIIGVIFGIYIYWALFLALKISDLVWWFFSIIITVVIIIAAFLSLKYLIGRPKQIAQSSQRIDVYHHYSDSEPKPMKTKSPFDVLGGGGRELDHLFRSEPSLTRREPATTRREPSLYGNGELDHLFGIKRKKK
ncbi:MAG TPA: hypothetical protein HA222_02935 [Candidatus Diapherotrites archaeon]|uniref:Uncharacterized protein n=1 Tax=Candidatus Iainarchaeum sp. TaxID=3101447 RepID=A0A7J4JX66_9ARCH|nr:hypothetical protein [Candidatus Diapherotrites archaeon]